MTNAKRPRGRPRKFDPEEVMAAIAELFRSKGYAATSLDDISQATALTRPSLYSAFGDKLSMYLQAMDHFGGRVRAELEPVFDSALNVEETLIEFYRVMLDIYFSGDGEALGCLVFGTAPAAAAAEEAIRCKLLESSNVLALTLGKVLAGKAQAASAENVQLASEMAANTLMALSVRSKAGVPQDELLAMCERSSKVIANILV
jgi:AcrR family transcriptional regulator